jgi:hypothetical protein
MKTALDSNIISSLWSNEPSAGLISSRLIQARREGSLQLSPIAYSELFAHPGVLESAIEPFLAEIGIMVDFEIGTETWAEAGRRFAKYADRRRRSDGGVARRLVADFVVGAHALLQADRLMTMDTRYRRDFPELNLLLIEE